MSTATAPPLRTRRIKTAAQAITYWRAACRKHRRSPGLKMAELGGDGADVPFEQALSNLAHAYLKSKAPGLSEYELGFQLIEKNEDNDKAIGVFGFQVGPQMLYAPVFFLNGELKGHELLYMKDSDTFVPLKENWVNYVLNRKPQILGESTGRNMRALGVERPSLDWMRGSPSKYASAQEPWLQEGLPGLCHAISNPVPSEFVPVVPKLVKESAAMAQRFLQVIDADPVLGKKFVQLYGPTLIKEAMVTAASLHTAVPVRPATGKPRRILTGSAWSEKTAAQVAYEVDPIRTGKLRIHTYDGTPPKGLTEKKAEKLKRDGIYIEDDRETASRIYRVQEPLTLQNPDQTGLYDILVKPNDFEKCLVLTGPYGRRGRKPGGVTVRLDDGGNKAWSHKNPGEIFADSTYSNDSYQTWFKGLPDADSGLDKGACYVLLAPNGSGTDVIEIEESLSSAAGEKSYRVYFHSSWGNSRPDHMAPIGNRGYEYANYDGSITAVSIGLKGGSKILQRQDVMYMPPGTKALKVKEPRKDDDLSCGCMGGGAESDPAPFEPGAHVDLQLGIYKMSSELKVMNDGNEAYVNGTLMPAKAAYISLIRDYGLREHTAKEVLKEAQVRHGQTFRIKYAAPYDLQQTSPAAPSFPDQSNGTDTYFGSGMPMQEYQEQEIPVDGMQYAERDTYNAARPPDPQMLSQLGEAAASGQQEVMDTSMLSNLLKGSRDDTLIDKYLGDLVKGLDRIGRLLFNFYWHYERFEERYGGSDLPELEDSLRNSFESLGDLVLFLKQKSIEPYPGEEGPDVDLGPTAEVS